ncbi:hypothetical protein M9458_052301 [Cirrhinus mrigala]|uniref:Uncharacterized protein n=1 Tax=Cirrhinus mrigala TaxID=683832 RepID=A0ABD0MTQ1_CIRMR
MGETRAPNIRRPPRARESQENHRRDNRGPHPEKGRGGPGGGSSGSHNADIPGGRGGKPAGSAGSRPHQSRPALGPVIQGPPTPQPGPSKARGARPRPATAESGPALTRASCPGARNHQRTGGRGHPPPRGNQRQTPELDPLHSGVETGRPPRSPAAAEKTTSPDPDRMASSSSQPPAPDREQRTGRHTRTPKPYLYVGVMEQEKGSIRDGEEIIGGGKVPPPLEPAPPLTPIGTPVAPNLPRAGGPGPSRPGPTAARDGPPDPTAEEKLPPPHHSVNSQTTEGNRHPGPRTRAEPKRMHQPTLPVAHQPGPKPPRPSRNPSPVAERPQNPKPPPRTYPGAVRLPGRQPTSAGTGLPSSAACSRQKNNTQEPPTPHPGQDRSPSAEPPKKPTPRELPDAPSPYGPPTATTKTKAGQNRDPHSH